MTSGGFNFGGFGGTQKTNGGTTGFSATSTPSLGFNFGGQTAASTPPTGALTLGGGANPVAGLGATSGVATSGAGGAATSGLAVGFKTPATGIGWSSALPEGAATRPAMTQQVGLPVGAATQPAPTQPTPVLSALTGFGATQKSTTLTIGGAPTATAAGITLGAPATSGAGGFKLGGAVTTQTTTTSTTGGGILGGMKLGTPASTSTSGFSLGTTSAATSTTGATPGFGGFAGQQATTGGIKLGTAATTTTAAATLSTTTTTTAAAQVAPSMNYRQLEEAINKWTLELEEQERIFLTQATKVNAWDRMLIDNGEKITQLNTDVERVKIDQQRLDHELDFILAQQRELEDMLTPLEKSMEQLPPINYQQHADVEREYTYQLAENVDAQLKRMVQDLKEIIEHLNASGSNPDTADPIHQVAKILNAHMDSLQWIDQNTAILQRRVEEVAKVADSQRKEQERNFRLAYD